MTTGVFVHEIFRGSDSPMMGDKFRDFPAVMGHARARPGMNRMCPMFAFVIRIG